MTKWPARLAADILQSCLALLPTLLITAAMSQAATFTTDHPGDQADVRPGDGTCAKSGGGCTLQAAVDEVNARDSADTIRHEVAAVDHSGVTITADNITIDGTQAPGFVPCTGWDCSAANWVGKLDMDGMSGPRPGINFALGATGGVVKGVEVYNGAGNHEYGINFESGGTATANRVHRAHGGIMCKAGTCQTGGPGATDTNWVHEIVNFGVSTQANHAVISRVVACLGADGESVPGPMRYGIYVEDADDVSVTNVLATGCTDAAIHTKNTSDRTAISDSTLGLTRSGATTHCAAFTPYQDDGTDTTFENMTLCPPATGCRSVTGFDGLLQSGGVAWRDESHCRRRPRRAW